MYWLQIFSCTVLIENFSQKALVWINNAAKENDLASFMFRKHYQYLCFQISCTEVDIETKKPAIFVLVLLLIQISQCNPNKLAKQ